MWDHIENSHLSPLNGHSIPCPYKDRSFNYRHPIKSHIYHKHKVYLQSDKEEPGSKTRSNNVSGWTPTIIVTRREERSVSDSSSQPSPRVKITLTVKTGVKSPVGSAVAPRKLVTPIVLENQALQHSSRIHKHHRESRTSGDSSTLSSSPAKIILKVKSLCTPKTVKRIQEEDLEAPYTKRVKRGEDLELLYTSKTATKIVLKYKKI